MWWAVVPAVGLTGICAFAPMVIGPLCKWEKFGIPRDRVIFFLQETQYMRRDKRLCPIPGKIYHNTTRFFDDEDLPVEPK